MKQFYYGSYKYDYELVRQNRKTLALTVQPDMRIELKAPPHASQDRIELFLRRKWLWLERQLRFFKKYKKQVYQKEYVAGEGFLYLGRLYTLEVKKSKSEDVIFYKGKITLYTTGSVRDSELNMRILLNWYRRKAQTVFLKRYLEISKKFELKTLPDLTIRKMPKRWGSFISKKKIVLNPELIKAPTECIDYVITHELCHMKYKDHSKKYLEYLNKMCPDWQKLKEKLELRMS